MGFNSITFKLLSFIIITFIVTTISILVLADVQLKQILDKSQEAVYSERINAILGTLKNKDERLKKTGLIEVYADDFKKSVITNLRKTYYYQKDQTLEPFILDADGKVIMHPVLPAGDLSLEHAEILEKMALLEQGNFNHVYHGQKQWCIYKRFSEWGWIIAYTVPLDIKYGDSQRFRTFLFFIMVGINAVFLMVLSLIVKRYTKPIIELTQVSTQIASGNLDQKIEMGGKDEIGTLARSFAHMRDSIKEKIEAQKIAEEQKKLALVGQVAGKMAHDFNNILGIIMGNTELSLIDCKDTETKKTLELIFEQTIRGKNLTRNLVAFAKDQEPKQEYFSINKKIELVLSLMKKDLEGIELIRKYEYNIPDLLADPGMIEHALVNMIQNSIHAITKTEYPRIMIRTYERNGRICFEITDNGCGIPKEHLGKIYDPSFTLKGSKDVGGVYKNGIKGTGYGMSNVKKYIKLHKGNISVESKLGSSTKFTITLPVIKKELTAQEKKEIRQKKTYFGRHILLVEDESAISGVQYRILSQDPYNHIVDIASDGQTAVDLFKKNHYELVSLDYVLPGKINGMDVYHHIRKTHKTIPVLFVSGNIEFLESIKKLKHEDANIDHLSKPCRNKDYANSINGLFEKI